MSRLYLMGAEMHWCVLMSFWQEMLFQKPKHLNCVKITNYMSFSAARHRFVQEEGVVLRAKGSHTSGTAAAHIPQFPTW